MARSRKRVLGNIPGMDLKILFTPRYRGIARDLKYIRDIVKYYKVFPHDMKLKNRDAKPIQPPQMEYSWYFLIRKMVNDGASVGQYQKYSLMWALIILGLYAQVRNIYLALA